VGGNLKKRSLDRDTIATQRALAQLKVVSGSIGSSVRGLGETVDDINSFDYTTFSLPDDFTETPPASGIWVVSVGVSDSEAVLSSCSSLSGITSWEITGGELTVATSGSPAARFLVF
jgi:hypothetical protein